MFIYLLHKLRKISTRCTVLIQILITFKDISHKNKNSHQNVNSHFCYSNHLHVLLFFHIYTFFYFFDIIQDTPSITKISIQFIVEEKKWFLFKFVHTYMVIYENYTLPISTLKEIQRIKSILWIKFKILAFFMIRLLTKLYVRVWHLTCRKHDCII